ncbi:MAG: class I SAM-dependent DNA methyltransferase [Bacteroidota bacterium]|jgi:hypothetical protein
MNLTQIDNNIQKLVKDFNQSNFIYELLLAYGMPKASIKRLQTGGLNLSKVNGEIAWKKKLFFKEVESEELYSVIDTIKNNSASIKHDPRFIIVTDYKRLLAIDTKTQDSLDIEILEIAKHYAFFLPWAGMEKAQLQIENPADVKAAEKMAKLFDEIKKDNETKTVEDIHSLNVFLSRLLFCFFAEDTGIFHTKGLFTNSVESHTQQDGSDLHTYLDNLFVVLNLEPKLRKNLPAHFEAFPYVNGGLFRGLHPVPFFSRKSRQALIDNGDLDWSAINPDIFGSMIQAVVTPEHRGGMGMHYTSVPNIMKVIEPLFLNDLYEEFEASKNEPRKLQALLLRISKIKIFDPACGSGNFLIIAYKELRLLEIKILQQLQLLQRAATGFEPYQLELIPKAQLTIAASYQPSLFSVIELQNFYGIELDDFAHEIAILSLWLAQHQMNQKFKEVFGSANPTLPLQAGGNIVQGNACRLNWEEVCPKKQDDEIYILGNPPYLGGKGQSHEQKMDIDLTFEGYKNYKELDYIACWFLLASKYIDDNSKFAFVTTSSICEGAQVEQMWPLVSKMNNEIYFAYSPFNWANNAKSKAGVTCTIIGIRKNSSEKKYFFTNKLKKQVSAINGYLTAGSEVYITKKLTSISKLPTMITGNSPYENGNLMLTPIEKEELIIKYPNSKPFIRKVTGANEFINGIERWCLWIENDKLKDALKIQPIVERLEKIKKFRSTGGEVARGLLNRPHQFRYTHTAKKSLIIIPIVSSSRREYIPFGILPSEYIILSSAAAIYDSEPFVFAIISSKIHTLWVRLTSGKLRGDIRYLSALSYNTFPFPEISESQKKELEKHTYRILEEREKHSEKTLAQLYDPDKMPKGLKEAHHQLDLAVEQCYRSKPFESDEERLEYLFKLYEQMIAEEKNKGTLFEAEEKPKKKTKKK